MNPSPVVGLFSRDLFGPRERETISTAMVSPTLVQGRKGKVWAYLLYSILIVFFLEDVFMIGISSEDSTRAYVMGVPLRDLGLIFALAIFAFNLKNICRDIGLLRIACYFFLVLSYSLLGIIRADGYNNIINADIRSFLWFVGGIVLGYALHQTCNIRLHLAIMLIAFTICCVLSSLLSRDFLLYISGINIRVTSPGMFIFGGAMLLPLILLINTTFSNIGYRFLCIGSMLLFTGFTAILSGTRSQWLASLILIALMINSSRIHVFSNTIVLVKISFRTIFFSLVLLFVLLGLISTFSSDSNIGRLTSILDKSVISEDSRAYEVFDFFNQSSALTLLVGQGLGGGINSSIYNGALTTVLHIGILNVWMKFGVLPFVWLTMFLYGYIPYIYLRSFSLLYRKTEMGFFSQDYANILILPVLFPWLISLLISGGFSELNFMIVGLVAFTYFHMKKGSFDGLRHMR